MGRKVPREEESLHYCSVIIMVRNQFKTVKEQENNGVATTTLNFVSDFDQ